MWEIEVERWWEFGSGVGGGVAAGDEDEGGRENERILVQTFCTRICIHCTPAAIDIITRGDHAARRGLGLAAGRSGSCRP